MANQKDITGFVAGDDWEIDVAEPDVPAGQKLVKAWLTIKAKLGDTDAQAIVQKVVTTTNVVGIGQITDDGTNDGVGAIRFDLVPADTAQLVPLSVNTPFIYDVQVKTDAGKVYTSLTGTVTAVPQVTQATT